MQERVEAMLEGVTIGATQVLMGIRVERREEDLFVIFGVPMCMEIAAEAILTSPKAAARG